VLPGPGRFAGQTSFGAPAETTQPADTGESRPATSEAPATTPQDVATGRMSEGEFTVLQRHIDEVAHESDQFGDMRPRCAALMANLELDAASTCMDDAYDGFEGDWLVAWQYAKYTRSRPDASRCSASRAGEGGSMGFVDKKRATLDKEQIATTYGSKLHAEGVVDDKQDQLDKVSTGDCRTSTSRRCTTALA
jgi:hypothetical protein